MTLILHVVGARPNFPKLAPVYRAGRAAGIEQVVVHTGQHYDEALSGSFIRDLGLAEPDFNLGVGSESHSVQTARILELIEPVMSAQRPDWVVVYGDVNSTLAAALVAAKLLLPIAHVEAGLRSHDRSMPEEINRIVTDRLADLLLTPSRDCDEILRGEGEPAGEIVFVGNVMVDSLLHSLDAARERGFGAKFHNGDRPVVVTLHRPSNVDVPDRFCHIAEGLREIARERRVVFPAHPRTQARLRESGIHLGRVEVIEPIAYLDMLDLIDRAQVVITDSGGLQEETTVLGVPCLTLRENTERPITITQGTNQLVPDLGKLPELVRAASRNVVARRPEGWDGRAGERIIQALVSRSTSPRTCESARRTAAV
jgi:UDP-N-acetylglucosamine 2-epimerase (non-hydrolysing)